MRVLEQGEVDRTVRMFSEDESRRKLARWISSTFFCMGDTMFDEAEKLYPDGLTYDEAKSFLESK